MWIELNVNVLMMKLDRMREGGVVVFLRDMVNGEWWIGFDGGCSMWNVKFEIWNLLFVLFRWRFGGRWARHDQSFTFTMIDLFSSISLPHIEKMGEDRERFSFVLDLEWSGREEMKGGATRNEIRKVLDFVFLSIASPKTNHTCWHRFCKLKWCHSRLISSLCWPLAGGSSTGWDGTRMRNGLGHSFSCSSIIIHTQSNWLRSCCVSFFFVWVRSRYLSLEDVIELVG